MTAVEKAMLFAEETFIQFNPRWSDKNYRIQFWHQAGFIERQVILNQLEQVAQQKLDTPEPL